MTDNSKNDPRAYGLFGEERETPEGSKPCPVCGEIMKTETKKEGIAVDVCKKHGIWLDTGEIEKILLKTRRKVSKPKYNKRSAIGRSIIKSQEEAASRQASWRYRSDPFGDMLDFLFGKK